MLAKRQLVRPPSISLALAAKNCICATPPAPTPAVSVCARGGGGAHEWMYRAIDGTPESVPLSNRVSIESCDRATNACLDAGQRMNA